MRDYPHPEDLGLNPEADRTEDLRPAKSEAPKVAAFEASEPLPNKKVGVFIMAQSKDNHPVDMATRHCCGGIGDHSVFCDINLPDPDVPVPDGANADGWNSLTLDGNPVRSLEWGRFDTAKVGVGVDGFQDATGEVTRCISLYPSSQDLDAADARALAAKLIEAADAMERLPQL
ncbi:hypothetical protein ACXYX3_01915 [Mycobacterium sp. C3-094]